MRAALAATVLLALAGCGPLGATTSVSDAPHAGPVAQAQLAQLPIRPEDTGAHYNRGDWGGWTSHGNGCDTRELVLIEQGVHVDRGKGCKPLCTLTSGSPCWISHYDAVQAADPGELQVDHLVPVKEANRSGTRHWTAQQRADFYNDRNNLRPVTIRANTSKGDRDPGTWRPPNREHWCAYASAYVQVKAKHQLSVDSREHDALAAMLATCTGGEQS